MTAIIEQVLPLLTRETTAADWEPLLADTVFYEALNVELEGKAEVAARLAAQPFRILAWSKSDIPGVAFAGKRAPGTRDRELLLLIKTDGGRIVRFSQQNVPALPADETPLRMDDEMRAKFDGALAGSHPIAFSYVDEQGFPHVSLRGSLITFGDDKLAMWARSATSGVATAITKNPNVALLFRDPGKRSTYQLRGRAYVSTDEATRKVIFDKTPLVERQHDFAMLGAAIVIELDQIEGWAGIGPQGVIGQVRMVRPR